MSSSLVFSKKKNPGCFVPGIFLIRTILYSIIGQSLFYQGYFDSGCSDQDYVRRANRLITKVQGVF
jgi:hypothetical protein